MITNAINAISEAFHAGPSTIVFFSKDVTMMKYFTYFVDSELSKHSNNDFELVCKTGNGYKLYNGSRIIFMDQADYIRGISAKVIFAHNPHPSDLKILHPAIYSCGKLIRT